MQSHRDVDKDEGMKRVLIIEDYANDVRLMSWVFERLPIHVELTHVEDGREAIRRCEGWSPLTEFFDLVLLDSRLQGISGLDVLKSLRLADPLAKVPIILLIGASGDDFSDIAMGYGADACIVKPLDPEAFMKKLRSIADTWLTPA